MNTDQLFEKARRSSFSLWMLNRVLYRMIPFNKPHGLKVSALMPEETIVVIPYKKKNLNHLKGLHACVLITGAEYCSGLVLLQHLNPRRYRLIMKDLKVTYHYQAKMEAHASFGLSSEFIEKNVVEQLKNNASADIECQIEVRDSQKNHLCTVVTNWQIKDWQKVKTKM